MALTAKYNHNIQVKEDIKRAGYVAPKEEKRNGRRLLLREPEGKGTKM
jgi:hypothetical protein